MSVLIIWDIKIPIGNEPIEFNNYLEVFLSTVSNSDESIIPALLQASNMFSLFWTSLIQISSFSVSFTSIIDMIILYYFVYIKIMI